MTQENSFNLSLDTKKFLLRLTFMLVYAIIYSARQLHKSQWRADYDTLNNTINDCIVVNKKAKEIYETDEN